MRSTRRADPVGLVADQPDQRALLGGHARLEQLRRAADAGQRVLDLVGERGAEAGDRARAAAMGQLMIEAVRDRAGMQHHQAVAGALGDRRDVQVDQAADAAVQRQLDAVVGDAVAGQLDAPDQVEQRAVERDQIGQRPVLEHRAAGAEQLLGGRVDEAHRELRRRAPARRSPWRSGSSARGGWRLRPADVCRRLDAQSLANCRTCPKHGQKIAWRGPMGKRLAAPWQRPPARLA